MHPACVQGGRHRSGGRGALPAASSWVESPVTQHREALPILTGWPDSTAQTAEVPATRFAVIAHRIATPTARLRAWRPRRGATRRR